MLCFPLLHLTPNPQLRNQFFISKFRHKTPFHHTPLKAQSGFQRIVLGTSCYCSKDSSEHYSGSISDEYDVELGRLLALLPEEMRRRVSEHEEKEQLIEVVMDFGRKPLARFPSGDFVLSDFPITLEDLKHATSQVGDFANDNRAGISKTLHRISAIRNRKSAIIGLTCRVGRAIAGSASLLRDLVRDGASLLLIGPPGVGKTTIIREIARMLANDYKKRVMIVDTSNEIGGDGDIPHAGIGNARRMQVPHVDMQHKVLIEAVENHMPQVIVIDEIGTKLEAMAASTIAQRGIQLVATAHGITIENLTMNPSLEMLVGGIQSVTLGDEEASRRRVQKTVLERKGPSTFSCAVEIISKVELRIHHNLEATVDAILAGRSPVFDVRKIRPANMEEHLQRETLIDMSSDKMDEMILEDVPKIQNDRASSPSNAAENSYEDGASLNLFVYGILEESVMQVIKQLDMDASVRLTDNISKADALLALHARLKKKPGLEAAAKTHNLPMYMTKTSSLVQITKALRALVNDHENGLKDFECKDNINFAEKIDALEEARVAIEQVVIPKGEMVELLPRSSPILSLQQELIRKYKLDSKKIGTGPEVRIRIVPFETRTDVERSVVESKSEDGEFDEYASIGGDTNGSLYIVENLPVLPD